MDTELDDVQVVAVPVTIHTKFGGDFVVKDIDAWSWQDGGIFAHGSWFGSTTDLIDVFIPLAQVQWMEYDFDALIEFQAEEFANEALGEGTDD